MKSEWSMGTVGGRKQFCETLDKRVVYSWKTTWEDVGLVFSSGERHASDKETRRKETVPDTGETREITASPCMKNLFK